MKTDYFLGYNRWLNGDLFVPCTSIFRRIVVYPNGDIPLCTKGDTGILGNLKEKSLEEIWWSKDTLRKQKEHIKCNRCWTSCHRDDDIFVYRAMKTFVPERLIDWWMRRGRRSGNPQQGHIGLGRGEF